MRPAKHKKLSKDIFTQALRKRVFVAIDAANIEKSAQDLPVDSTDVKRESATNLQWRVDYKKLIPYFKNNSKLKRTSFYTASFKTKPHNDFYFF